MAFTNNPKFLRAADGGLPIIREFREADSQSFTAGELVYLSTGYVTVCASDTAQILGIAMKAATNVTTGHIQIPVMIIRPGDEIKIRSTSGGTDTACAITDIGVNHELYVASNVHYVDLAAESNDRFTIQRLLYKGDQSTADGYWVVVTVCPAACQYGYGA